MNFTSIPFFSSIIVTFFSLSFFSFFHHDDDADFRTLSQQSVFLCRIEKKVQKEERDTSWISTLKGHV
jgi:hypothetical protein